MEVTISLSHEEIVMEYMKRLKVDFEEAMYEVNRLGKAGWGKGSSRFVQTIESHGAVGAAQYFINKKLHPGQFYMETAGDKPELTMEWMIWHNPKFHVLFTVQQLEICRKRLQEAEELKGSLASV